MQRLSLFLIFCFFINSLFAQPNQKSTFVTFIGEVFELTKDSSSDLQPLENAFVEIYFNSYAPSNLQNSCDCDEEGFECSVNIEKDTKVILVIKSSNYSKEVKDFLIKRNKETSIVRKDIKAVLFKTKHASSSPIKDSDNPILKLFKQPRFDLSDEHVTYKHVDNLFFNKIELYGESINGRFLYFPDQLIDADGVWFKVTYQDDLNTVKQDSAFVYYDFSKEFKATLQPAFVAINQPCLTYDKDNYVKSKSKLKDKGPHRISNICILDLEEGLERPTLLFLDKIEKWITNEPAYISLLTEKEAKIRSVSSGN